VEAFAEFEREIIKNECQQGEKPLLLMEKNVIGIRRI
jgi:hypothetical protein